MKKLPRITNDEIQDYIDDRLDPGQRARVASFLKSVPAKATEVESLRLEDDLLRALGNEILIEPIPQRLLGVLHSAESPAAEVAERAPPRTPPRVRWRMTRFLEAAAAILLFVVGGGVGWGLHSSLYSSPSAEEILLTRISQIAPPTDRKR